MPDHESLKSAHEVAIASHLVACLRAEGVQIGDPIAGNIGAREPDAVYHLPNGMRGIEVASAYYNDDEAKEVWAPARGQAEQSRRLLRPGERLQEVVIRRAPVLVNGDNALAKALQRTLSDHCAKHYNVPTYLVLDATTAALTTADDGPSIVAQLRVPGSCEFLAVYLALKQNYSSEVVFFAVDNKTQSRTPVN